MLFQRVYIVTFAILHGLSIERLSTANHCFGPQASPNELNISCGFTAARIQFSIIVICVRKFHSWCFWFVELCYVNTSFALLHWFSTHSHFRRRTTFRSKDKICCMWMTSNWLCLRTDSNIWNFVVCSFSTRFFFIKRMWKC